VCGILGAYDVAAGDDRRLAAMSDAIAYRGSDVAGTWASPGAAQRVWVGYRRAVTSGNDRMPASHGTSLSLRDAPANVAALSGMARGGRAEHGVGRNLQMIRRSRCTLGALNASRRIEGQA
jgi:hypothetical protein